MAKRLSATTYQERCFTGIEPAEMAPRGLHIQGERSLFWSFLQHPILHQSDLYNLSANFCRISALRAMNKAKII